MFPGMNPRDMEKVMAKMGIKQQEIAATEVRIRCPDREIVIHNPKVSKINMMGQETFQIMGTIKEQPANSNPTAEMPEEAYEAPAPTVTDEDIGLVAQQAHVSDAVARRCLQQANGDLAKAIMLARKNPKPAA